MRPPWFDPAALETLVLWPKLFRRLVPYLAAGNTGFDGFDAFLPADPVNGDDKLFLLDRLEPGNLHDVVRGSGDQIQLTVLSERFIIEPDAAPSGGAVGGAGRPSAVGDVLIMAALPDPIGADAGQETVSLLNATAAAVDLAGWALAGARGQRESLGGILGAGATVLVRLSTVQLGNRGDTLMLIGPRGDVVDPGRLPGQPGPARTHHRVRALGRGTTWREEAGANRGGYAARSWHSAVRLESGYQREGATCLPSMVEGRSAQALFRRFGRYQLRQG